VSAAFAALERRDSVVVVPADDGGYALIGLRRPVPAIFRGVPWGGPHVLGATRRQAAAAGLAWVDLEPWYDVDDAAGLRRLGADLRGATAARRAPATVRLLLDRGFVV
jgi:glycosyltransferase A (GT-A) superfamily protein (DUF2064 family)